MNKKEKVLKYELGGVYSISYNDKIIYIGSTTNFEKRFRQHKYNIENNSDELFLYKWCNYNFITAKELLFKPILTYKDISKANQKVTSKLVRTIEFALILEHKPRCNVEGKYVDFHLIDKRKK